MKKLIAILLCLCLGLSLLAGCGGSRIEYYDEEETTEAPEAAESADTAEADAPAEAAAADAAEAETGAAEPAVSIGQGGTGFETYPADTVVGTVNGAEMTWMEYHYWLRYVLQYYLQLGAQLGITIGSWDGHEISAGETNEEVILSTAQNNAIQDLAVVTEAAKRGVELTDEDRQTVEEIFEQNADSMTGDGDGVCTEEEAEALEALFAEQGVDRAFFDYLTELEILTNAMFIQEYGELGADFPDEAVLSYAEENGMMAAKHILLLTVDPATGESLGEDVAAEKLAIAQDLLSQLEAVRDDTEARVALFDQLTAEYTEDTGYEHYPDGYVFTSGQMVTAFEDAVKSLENDYDISDIVESEYGYHIVMRIPVDPDFVTGTASNGAEVTLRQTAASQQFSAELTALVGAAMVIWNEGFAAPDLPAIFG